jgi:hypothetical protein
MKWVFHYIACKRAWFQPLNLKYLSWLKIFKVFFQNR